MASVKLKFRASQKEGKEGVLYYQLIQDRNVKRITTTYHIYPKEWDSKHDSIIIPEHTHTRYPRLTAIQMEVKWDLYRIRNLIDTGIPLDNVCESFDRVDTGKGISVFDYAHQQVERLRELGRIRCSETRESALRCFMKFRGFLDLGFDHFNKDLIERYEAWMKEQGVSRNTSSFYLRNLRSIYSAAIEDGIIQDLHPFIKVYTGVDKTVKRAISLDELRHIKNLNLEKRPALAVARDIMMFSFYARGMSFVDMAYLRKKDITGSHIVYRRKKTGQLLEIEIVPQMQEILSKYQNETQYLLPIILREDGTERKQYRNLLVRINRNLKKIGNIAGLPIPLSTYVARHTWATLARDKNIPLSIISEGLGHDNEKTTRIYLDSIHTSRLDEANRLILDDL